MDLPDEMIRRAGGIWRSYLAVMRFSALILPISAALAVLSCATNNVSPSGFLTNYSQLGPDKTRYDAAAVYLHPTVDFNKYDSIVVDPPAVYPGASQISSEQQAKLGAYLRGAFVSKLGRDYKMVSAPGPKTMRLRVALAGVSDPAAGTGVKAFVKTTQVEAELIDSSTNMRLAAISGKTLSDLKPDDTLETVEDVKDLLDASATSLANRLKDLRARINPGS